MFSSLINKRIYINRETRGTMWKYISFFFYTQQYTLWKFWGYLDDMLITVVCIAFVNYSFISFYVIMCVYVSLNINSTYKNNTNLIISKNNLAMY